MGIDDQRRAYRASWRRLRRKEGHAEGGEQDLGSSEDDDEEETLREKMTRLRRETREVMDEVERRTTAEETAGAEGKGKLGEEDEVRELCRLMEQTRKRYEGLEGSAFKELEKLVSQSGHTRDTAPKGPEVHSHPSSLFPSPSSPLTDTLQLPSIPLTTTTTQPSPALLKASDLERRLSTLETVLGLSHPRTHANFLSPIPLPIPSSSSSETIQQPILQSLTALEHQLALLSTDPPSSSSPALDALLHKSNPSASTAASPPSDPEQASRIKQLYATLPTIEALTPHLSHTLTRLQSLRYIHTDAAGVSASLGRLEGKAEEVEKEIAVWRQGVERVEALVAQGAMEMVGGGKAVEERVRGLEDKVGASQR